MLMPAPIQRSKAYILIEVFSKEAWTCLLVFALLRMITLWLSYFPNPELRNLRMPLSRWFLFVISSLSLGERGYVMYHRGGDKSFSLVYRQSVLFWCLPAMVLLNGYKAIFFALLSIPQYNYLIGGISDLPQRENEINVYVPKGSAMEDFFNSQTEGPFQWVRDDLLKHPERKLNQNELNRVFEIVKDNNVFCGPKIGLCQAFADMDRQMHNPPRVHVSKQFSFPRGRSMMIQKGSPLKPILDKQILLMHQHGLIEYSLRRRLPVQDRRKSEEEQKKLTLTDLIGAFMLYGIFFGISLVIFVVEIIWYYIYRGCLKSCKQSVNLEKE